MSETWVRAAVAREDAPKEPWHLVVSWIHVENQKNWTTTCGLYITHDVEETEDRETVDGETTCFNCYTIQARERLREDGEEISSAPLEEDYEPQVMDPSHVTVSSAYDPRTAEGERVGVGTMQTPAIDPDQEMAAYVAGWLASVDGGTGDDVTMAVDSYQRWIESGRP